jgi:hypothetical protein
MRFSAWPLLLMSVAAWASDGSSGGDDDAAALALSGAPASAAAAPRSTTVTIEGALTEAAEVGNGAADLQRLSVDARFDSSFSPGWRAVLAERLDSTWAGSFGGNQEVGTLKEAYVSWQPMSNLLVDAGRVNARQGVAFGYNPTDFLRADAIRSLVSLDPNSLRDNRLGTVMLRAEELWDSGAVTFAYAPPLPSHSSAATFDPDWGATNAQGSWMLSASQQVAAGWTPQWVAYGRQGQSPQLGMNLTAAIGSSTVAFLEVSGGRSVSLLAQAVNLPEQESFRSRAASGLTYSLANKLSLTVEYEYNGAGSNSPQWSTLRSGNPAVYGRYREFALLQQDLPTRSNAFAYASWQDLIVRHLDLTAFMRVDLVDHSRLPWLELRRHWDSVDVAMRWQTVQGGATTDFGASPQRQTWQLLFDYYL